MSWNFIAPIITNAVGAAIGKSANNEAAQIAANATLQGAQIGADAIREGNTQAQNTLNTVRKEAAPATSYLRGVIAQEGSLTPAQASGLTDARRTVANTIHSSNFAGSGRTATALFRKAESDFTNNALDSNSQRAFQAATGMQGGATSAATGIANSQANTGNAVGKLMSDATTKAGLYDANATTANGKLTGEALGTIGATIANEQRASRYGDRMAKIEKALGVT